MNGQKATEVLFKIVLLLVWPTPKNMREFFGMVQQFLGGDPKPDRFEFSANQWDEIRRARDEAERKDALKARKGQKKAAGKPKPGG